jgi:hypothetical protein
VNERPIGEALILCDQIITEAITNKKSLIGVFNHISGRQFPLQLPRLCIFCVMSNGRGEMTFELRCVRMEDSYEVAKITAPIVLPDPNTVVELVLTLNHIPFERPGLYNFEMHCEGEIVLEKRFNVLSLPPPLPPSEPSRQ